MREIKFRVWDTAKKQPMMHFGPQFSLDDDQDNLTFGPGDGSRVLGDYDSGERFVLMQFTGLLDKNGKEVYEGDIVNCSSGCPHEVVWLDAVPSSGIGGMPGFYLSGLNDGYSWSFIEGYPVDEEVIGNIYENSDLLV